MGFIIGAFKQAVLMVVVIVVSMYISVKILDTATPGIVAPLLYFFTKAKQENKDADDVKHE